LDEVMMAVPRMLGQKFKYSRVNHAFQAASIKNILDLLSKARICSPVISCAANGVPLASEVNDKHFKEVFLDTGLCSVALGLNFNQIRAIQEITLINSGGIAEQVVGQLLRTINPPYVDPALFYWLREEKASNAEVDYVIEHSGKVIPIEVKAGSTGTLRSLHVFMELKQFPLAVRINSELPAMTLVKNPAGRDVTYKLISLPFYLIGQIVRLIENIK
jgi:predicted AAA+ superfamily ATPase